MFEERHYSTYKLADELVFRYELLKVLKEISYNLDQVRMIQGEQ